MMPVGQGQSSDFVLDPTLDGVGPFASGEALRNRGDPLAHFRREKMDHHVKGIDD